VRCVRFYEGSLGFEATVGDATVGDATVDDATSGDADVETGDRRPAGRCRY
jgi:hypothetical protein